MATISKRFENQGGRYVERIPCEIGAYSTLFAGPGGTLDAKGNQGIGFMVRTDDGRTLWVYLTHAEFADLVRQHAELSARYPANGI